MIGGAQQPGSMRVNFSWNVVANVAYAGAQWLVLVLSVRWYGAAEFGKLAFALALAAPAMVFSNLQLRAVLLNERDPRSEFGRYLAARIWTTAAVAAPMLAVASMIERGQGQVLFFVVAAKAFESVSDILHGLLQASDRLDIASRSLIARSALTVLFTAAAVSFGPGIAGVAGGVALAAAVPLALWDIPAAMGRIPRAARGAAWRYAVRQLLDNSRDVRVVTRLALGALPLGVVQALGSLSYNIPRYALRSTGGNTDLGIYSAVASLMVAGQIVVTALGQSAAPVLARAFGNRQVREFSRTLGIVLGGSVVPGLIGTVIALTAGGPILRLLFRPEFGSAKPVLVAVMIASCFAYGAWALGFGITAARQFWGQVPMMALVCVAAWLGSLLLVPRYGVEGAAWALAASMAVQALAASVLLIRAVGGAANHIPEKIAARSGKPLRVLHVHTELMWGGVENWLSEMASRADLSLLEITFFSAEVSPARAAVLERAGATLLRSPWPRQFFAYRKSLRRVLRNQGPFDVVHCHFIDHCGWVLAEARLAGVRHRIAHSHIDVQPVWRLLPWWRKSYFLINSWLVRRCATKVLATSTAAARSWLGDKWRKDQRCAVLHCGLSLEALRSRRIPGVRGVLGIGEDEFVFGHIGRYTSQKNHAFLVDLASELVRLMPNAKFLWIGDGPLEQAVDSRLRAQAIEDRVIRVSPRADAVALMRDAMDAFILPSVYEGLGLVAVEAQAAGLRCFLSSAIPPDADVIPELVVRLDLERGPAAWAGAITESLGRSPSLDPAQCLRVVEDSSFNVERSAEALHAVYREAFT